MFFDFSNKESDMFSKIWSNAKSVLFYLYLGLMFIVSTAYMIFSFIKFMGWLFDKIDENPIFYNPWNPICMFLVLIVVIFPPLFFMVIPILPQSIKLLYKKKSEDPTDIIISSSLLVIILWMITVKFWMDVLSK
jgi:hypothetical protein